MVFRTAAPPVGLAAELIRQSKKGMEKRGLTMKVLPWLLIFGGFYFLSRLPWMVALGCMLIGIVMLIERIWPEKWASDTEEE